MPRKLQIENLQPHIVCRHIFGYQPSGNDTPIAYKTWEICEIGNIGPVGSGSLVDLTALSTLQNRNGEIFTPLSHLGRPIRSSQ